MVYSAKGIDYLATSAAYVHLHMQPLDCTNNTTYLTSFIYLCSTTSHPLVFSIGSTKLYVMKHLMYLFMPLQVYSKLQQNLQHWGVSSTGWSQIPLGSQQTCTRSPTRISH